MANASHLHRRRLRLIIWVGNTRSGRGHHHLVRYGVLDCTAQTRIFKKLKKKRLMSITLVVHTDRERNERRKEGSTHFVDFDDSMDVRAREWA